MNKTHLSKSISAHDEVEVANFRLDIDKEPVLKRYHNLAKFWWWDGLNIKAVVDEDPKFPNRFIVHQTIDSPEYALRQNPVIPYILGYMEILNTVEGQRRPIDVRLVCSWKVVSNFWKELENNLRKEFIVVIPISEKEKLRLKLPKNSTRLAKWIYIANTIDFKKFPGGLKAVSIFIQSKHPGFPYSREILGLIRNAKGAGLLEPSDSGNKQNFPT